MAGAVRVDAVVGQVVVDGPAGRPVYVPSSKVLGDALHDRVVPVHDGGCLSLYATPTATTAMTRAATTSTTQSRAPERIDLTTRAGYPPPLPTRANDRL